MTAPTPEYLRAIAADNDRSAGISMPAGLAEQHTAAVSAALRAAADEVDRLREVIADLPHGDDCHWGTVMNYDELYPCVCWKADLL